MYLKMLRNTRMNGSREDTEQELKRQQVKQHRVWTEARGGPTMAEDGHSVDNKMAIFSGQH
jgi:hypothetical protein